MLYALVGGLSCVREIGRQSAPIRWRYAGELHKVVPVEIATLGSSESYLSLCERGTLTSTTTALHHQMCVCWTISTSSFVQLQTYIQCIEHQGMKETAFGSLGFHAADTREDLQHAT